MPIQFPVIPKSKVYGEKMTPEQEAVQYYLEHGSLSKEHEEILKECIDFYSKAFSELKKIDLSEINEDTANEIISFLTIVFNVKIIIQNEGKFDYLFRVTIVDDQFLEKGKLRNPQYLYNPPLKLNQAKGIYNRCNSPNSTGLYAAFYENVAFRESKPQKGQRIILTTWKNKSGQSFVSYPISNAMIANNQGNSKATAAFIKTMENHHPFFSSLLKLNLEFLASEFIKESQIKSAKRFEYMFSAFFSEFILSDNNINDPTPNFDFIIYPSVAFKHLEDNIFISPRAISKVTPVYLQEFIVLETHYDKELSRDESPLELKLLRDASWIEDNLIIWND